MSQRISRRKNYFEITRQHKINQQKTLLTKLRNAQIYASQIGLNIESIILGRIHLGNTSRNNCRKIKIIIKEANSDEIHDEKQNVFKCLVAKDRANVSCLKYKLFKSNLNFVMMPGINKLRVLQKK